MENRIVLHLAQFLFEHCFGSKHEMSNALGLSYRAVLRLFKGISFPKDTENILSAILWYCVKSNIPPQEMLRGFPLWQ